MMSLLFIYGHIEHQCIKKNGKSLLRMMSMFTSCAVDVSGPWLIASPSLR
jgi:hypothetical protein